ncbi:hypothetical protein LguiB_021506 [Lonicera macranthoides]
MAGNFPISQDWEAVVIRKKASTAAAPKDEKAVNMARRFGAEIETIQKSTTAIALGIYHNYVATSLTRTGIDLPGQVAGCGAAPR